MIQPAVHAGYVTRTVTVSARTPHHIDVATIPAGTQILYRPRACTCCVLLWVPGTRLSQVVRVATVSPETPFPHTGTGTYPSEPWAESHLRRVLHDGF